MPRSQSEPNLKKRIPMRQFTPHKRDVVTDNENRPGISKNPSSTSEISAIPLIEEIKRIRWGFIFFDAEIKEASAIRPL